MAKVKTIRIHQVDRKTNTVLLDCNVDIKVSTSGVFYAALPDEQYQRLKAINMLPNGYDANKGISASTMSELESKISDAIQPLVEFKQIENKIVIKYEFQTGCEYCKSTDGKYFPHATNEWGKEDIIREPKGNPKFFSGTERRDNISPGPYMVSIAVIFRRRITNEYKDGTQKTYYEPVYHGDKDLGENGKWLRELRGMWAEQWKKEDTLPEIDYTETNALMFRKFIEGIFYVNDFVRNLNNSEMLEAVIKNNKILTIGDS